MNCNIKIKRIYEPATISDGYRILIDRLWPRGLSKEKAKINLWLKEIAPSNELRKWFNHEPAKWKEFQKRYKDELLHDKEAKIVMEEFKKLINKKRMITLLFSASDEEHNNAVAFQQILKYFLKSK